MEQSNMIVLTTGRVIINLLLVVATIVLLSLKAERSLMSLSNAMLKLNLWLAILLSVTVSVLAIYFIMVDIKTGMVQGWSTAVKIFHPHIGPPTTILMPNLPPVWHIVCHLTDFMFYGVIPSWFWFKCRSILRQRQLEHEFQELIKRLKGADA